MDRQTDTHTKHFDFYSLKILVIGLGPEGRFLENLSDRTDTVFFPISEVSKGTVSLEKQFTFTLLGQEF